MRRWIAVIGVACAAAGTPSAQQPSNGASMPGQVVSTGFNLKQAGTRVPAAAPQAGNGIGSPLASRPYDPSRPLDSFRGTGIDPKSVIAPVSGIPGTQQPDLLDRLYAKLGSVTGFLRPTVPTAATPTVTPGIFRRNRERHSQQNWRRD